MRIRHDRSTRCGSANRHPVITSGAAAVTHATQPERNCPTDQRRSTPLRRHRRSRGHPQRTGVRDRARPLCVHQKILMPLALNRPGFSGGPLEAFQARCLDELGMRRLVQDMMTLREKPPAQAQIDQLFQAMWPALESHMSEAKQQSPSPQNSQRTTKEMLEELVDRVRRIEREYSPRTQSFVSSGFGVRASDTASTTDQISPPPEYFHPTPQ
jgi:hypothetical protein